MFLLMDLEVVEMDAYNSVALFQILAFDMTPAVIKFAFVVVALLSP
jgi:hypothetical protein